MVDKLALSTVPAHLVTSLCKIAEVELSETECHNYHKLFRAIGQSSDIKLRKMVLNELLLDRVDSKTLALAITKVEEITLNGVSCTYEAIFRALSQSEPKLKKLRIKFTSEIMDWVRDVDSMAQAVCMIENLELIYCGLTSDQLDVIFRNISTASKLYLQSLTIIFDRVFGSDVSGVSSAILASAVCRLKRCYLCNSGMTSEQVEKLCGEIVSCKNLPLSYLNIGNTPQIEYVNKDILASAVVRLEIVELVFRSTDVQLQAILRKVVECDDSKLKELCVEDVDEEKPETQSLLLKVKGKTKIFKVVNWWSDDDSLKQLIV